MNENTLHWKGNSLYMGKICVGSVWEASKDIFYIAYPAAVSENYNFIDGDYLDPFTTKAKARKTLEQFVKEQMQ